MAALVPLYILANQEDIPHFMWIITHSYSVMSNSTKSMGFLCPWNSWSKNTGVSGHSLLQGIFLIQGSNQAFLHYRQILLSLSCQGSPRGLSVEFSCSVVSSCLRPRGLQHARHPTISSSVVPFSSCLQSFPASGSFPMSQFFTSGGQSIGVSASASVFPMNIQDWFPLGLTGWISLQSKVLSRVFSNTTVQKHQFFGAQLSL